MNSRNTSTSPRTIVLDQSHESTTEEVDMLLSPRRNHQPQAQLTGASRVWADSANRTAVKNLALILGWYCLSTMLTLFNKMFLGKDHGIFGSQGGFPAPLFMTSIQFFVQWALSGFVLWMTCCSPEKEEATDWYEWLTKVFPNAASTGLDIGLSNRSLVYITVSFYTMCKSTVPLWLLTFAFIFKIETPSWSLFSVMVIISSGLLLLVAGETKFHFVGFVMVMSASLLSGFRWTITQILLQPKASSDTTRDDTSGHEHEGKQSSPVAVMYKLLPVMSGTVALMSLVSEKVWISLPETVYFESYDNSTVTVCFIALGALIAFLMVWLEFKVIQETSALTFMVAGTFKEVVTVLSSVIVFGDEFHVINGLGLVVLLAGVALYNYLKVMKMRTGKIRVKPAKSIRSPRLESGEGIELVA